MVVIEDFPGEPLFLLASPAFLSKTLGHIFEKCGTKWLIHFAGSLSLRKRPSLQQRASNVERIAEKGMILPFQPLALTFDNMWYSVDMPKVRHVEATERL